MTIVLDNSETSHNIAEPITGKIKVNLTGDGFDAKAVTLSLLGYQNISFTGRPDKNEKILEENFVIAEFPEGGPPLNGQSEYLFSLVLPDCVQESVMVQSNKGKLSEQYFLTA